MTHVDVIYGDEGYGIWVAPIGLVASIAAAFFLSNAAIIFYSRDDLSVAVIFLVALIYTCFLIFLSAVIFFHGIKTMRRVDIDAVSELVTARSFFGKKINFTRSEVSRIDKVRFPTSLFSRSPLAVNGGYYKVYLARGETLFLGGGMSDIDQLMHFLGDISVQ